MYVSKLENGAYRITGTRVSLDSIVYAFWRGESPEKIVNSFPLLTLEQVYGAIAYYLANRAEIGEYLKQSEADFVELSEKWREKNELLYRKLEKARHNLQVTP